MTYKPDKLTLDYQPIAGRRSWTYSDTGSTFATVTAADAITDGKYKGLKVDDRFCYINETAHSRYELRVSALNADTGAVPGAATIAGDTGAIVVG